MSADVPLFAAVVATALVAAADWVAVVRDDRRTRRWAKPAVLVGLVAVALALGAAGSATGRLVLLALVLGLVGDVLLLGEGERRFLGGLAAFLLGHLAWVGAFLSTGLDRPVLGWVGAAAVALALVVGRGILPAVLAKGGAVLGAAVAAYAAVLGAMAVTGWATGHLLVGLGAVLFVASDTVLALGRFVGERRWTGPVVLVTYHLAQALLLAGLLA